MKELRRLVREGKLFAVQKWIADGKRTFDPYSAWSSPLEIAVDSRRDLTSLSGKPVLEPGEKIFIPAEETLRWREEHLTVKY